MFGSMCKWVTEIDDPARIPEIVSRAFYTADQRPARAGGRKSAGGHADRARRGRRRAAVLRRSRPRRAPPKWRNSQQLLGARADADVHDRRQPLVAGGVATISAASRKNIRLPVCTTFRRLHLFDALHPCYAGDLGIGPNPKLLERIKAADLVVLIGGRLGELPSQSYTLFDIPRPQMTFVHVHPGAEELGRVYSPNLAIHATPDGVCRRARASRTLPAPLPGRATPRTPTISPGRSSRPSSRARVNLGAVMVWLRDNLPADAIICNGAGNYAAWIHRFFRFRRFAQHVAPTSGSMGYGVPAAVAMKRLYPERPVVCIAGDGDFLMNGQEFATAVQYGLPLIVVIADNGLYGTIRMHQEREYPGRIIATDLRNPDFAAYARAFGGFGVSVERTADFPAAFKEAVRPRASRPLSGLPSTPKRSRR